MKEYKDCKSCNEPKNNCNNEILGCKIKLSPECVINSCNEYECLNLKKGDSLKTFFKKLNKIICDIWEYLQTPFINIGCGEEVYSGQNDDDIHQFRTLKGTTSIRVVTEGDEIYFSVDKVWLRDVILDVIRNKSN